MRHRPGCDNRSVLGRRLPWLLSLPLIVAGSLAAHAAGSATTLGSAGGHAETSEIGAQHARESGGYAGHAVIWLGLIAAICAVGTIRAGFSRGRGRESRGIGATCFFLLPLIAYSSQELIERLLHAESFPFHAVFEPHFLLGLALQLPFAIATFALGWLLLKIGKRLMPLLSEIPVEFPSDQPALLWAHAGAALPHVRALSRGHPLRGPPLLA